MGAANLNHRNRREGGADEADFFPTPPWATRALMEVVGKDAMRGKQVLEPAAGNGDISRVLRVEFGAGVTEYDIHDYRTDTPTPQNDFLQENDLCAPEWIVTNPPYKYFNDFIVRALMYQTDPAVAILGRTQGLESKGRYWIFKNYPPAVVAIFAGRIPFAPRRVVRDMSCMQSHAWYIWNGREKTAHGHTRLRWIDFGAQKRLERDEDYEHPDGKRTASPRLV